MKQHKKEYAMLDRRTFIKAGITCILAAVSSSPLFGQSGSAVVHAQERSVKPNIVYILADDLGFGDVHCLNPDRCRIPTPQIDSFAKAGMTFTDAHSGSSVCTPTRYGIMTGRYAWRTRLQKGVIKYGAPLIAKERTTVAGLLSKNGYRTAGFGKWHLGLKYSLPGNNAVLTREPASLPVGSRIIEGPVERGFDQYYWFKLFKTNWTMIENDEVVEQIPLHALLPRLLERGKAYIAEQAKSGKPFFMYWAPPVPHTPLVPSAEWKGKSELGTYGDYVMQLDAAVGELMATLDEHGIAENTLVIVTSDNGTAPYIGVDKLEKKGHFPSAGFRGYKSDVWDGGHRIPFFARWPGKIKAGNTTSQLTCLTDFMATAADLIGVDKAPDWGEDSISILPALLEGKVVNRGPVVHHSFHGQFALRNGNWKLVFCPGSGGWGTPNDRDARKKKMPPVQLYNMENDDGEKKNLQAEHPEVVANMTALMKSIMDRGRSTDGPEQKNDVPVRLLR